MQKCIEKFLEQRIIKKIKKEKEENFEYKFSLGGVNSLIFNYYDGRAYLSCFNDEKEIYFDATVKWIEENGEVELEIEYKDVSEKKNLGIYNYL